MPRLDRSLRPSLLCWFAFAALLISAVPLKTHAGEPADGKAALTEADELEKAVQTLFEQGQYDLAARMAERVLGLRKKALPAGDHRIAMAMSDLGALLVVLEEHKRGGDLIRAAEKELAASRKNTPEHAVAVNNLAGFHAARGERSKALPLYELALEITEAARGPEHADVAQAKHVLAKALVRNGRRNAKAALKLLADALAIYEKAGDERKAVRVILDTGRVRKEAAMTRTEEAFEEALARGEKAFPAGSPELAELYYALAELNRRVASSAGSRSATATRRRVADDLYGRTERTYLSSFGPRHTRLADLYSAWALNAQAAQDWNRAVELRTKANDIENEQLDVVLAGSSESVKLSYLDKFSSHANDTVSMHYKMWLDRKGRHQGASRLALGTVLRRKGRALDAVAENLATLRAQVEGDDRKLLEELQQVRARLAVTAIHGPDDKDVDAYKQEVSQLSAQARQLEKQVAEASTEYRKTAAPVTVEAVQKAIPKDAALVEIVRMRWRDPRAYSSGVEYTQPRYVAYVLRRSGPIKFAHLSETRTIDTIVGQLRKGLADPANKRAGDPAWRLYTQTFARIKPLLGDAKHIIIAPEGSLNLVPFGALLDGDGFLIEKWAFSYLSSGRDLLRFAHHSRAHSGPLVVADPSFDTAGKGQPAGSGTRSGTLASAKFPGLPGTRQEAQALEKLLPDAALLVGGEATERALKRVQGPSILHVATHGFFLDEKRSRRGRRDRGLELAELKELALPRPKARPKPLASWLKRAPLLRSGIALAGANLHRRDAEDDGILTALEAASLDLHGTQLVTLSACETGIGKVVTGEGVYGLRRALVIAGSDSQIMSLWKVDDAATRDLMIAFYQKLLDGQSRAQAMRAVQLDMIKSHETQKRGHPYFWGAFIISGNPGPLDLSADSGGLKGDGKTEGGSVPGVDPGPRGCACHTAGRPRPNPTEFGWLGSALLGTLLVRARRRRSARAVPHAA